MSKIAQATTQTEAPPASTSAPSVHTIKCDLMTTMAIHQFREGKKQEQGGRIGTASAKAALGTLKELANQHIQDNFQGCKPPDRVELVGEDGVAITLNIGSSSTAYGTTKMPRFTSIDNADALREITGNDWMEANTDDNSRVIIHLPMIKDELAKSTFEDAIVDVINRFEGDGAEVVVKDDNGNEETKVVKIPKGVFQVEERIQAKATTFAEAVFNLDHARFTETMKLLGGPSITAGKFKA